MCCFPAMFSLFFQKRGEAIYAAKGDMLPDTYMYKIFKSTAELKIRYGYGMYFSAYVEVDTARRTAEACACLRVAGSGLAIAFLRCH